MENKPYDPKSLISFTWCPITDAPVTLKQCAFCEHFASVRQEKPGTANIPLPYISLKCRHPRDRAVYVLDGVEIVSCSRLKYNPYVKVTECEKCTFFVNRGTDKGGAPVIFCRFHTEKKVAFAYTDFKAMGQEEDK